MAEAAPLNEQEQEKLASATADFLENGDDASLRAIISVFDRDADGKITTDEMKLLMASELGSELDEEAANGII